jgi:hypothetical protein
MFHLVEKEKMCLQQAAKTVDRAGYLKR